MKTRAASTTASVSTSIAGYRVSAPRNFLEKQLTAHGNPSSSRCFRKTPMAIFDASVRTSKVLWKSGFRSTGAGERQSFSFWKEASCTEVHLNCVLTPSVGLQFGHSRKYASERTQCSQRNYAPVLQSWEPPSLLLLPLYQDLVEFRWE